MHKRLWYLSLAAAVALIAGACEPLSGPNGQLTDDEAAFLAQEFADVALNGVSASMAGAPGFAGAPSAADAPAAGPITWERTFTETRPCPAGGTRTTSGSSQGTIDSETRSGTVEVNHTLAMDDCARTRGDVTITVNTDPAITIIGTVTIEAGHRAGGSFTKTGTFFWTTSDGRSGSCEVNLTITWGPDGDHTMTGTMCGRDVSQLDGTGRKR